jgi:two-component system LytT family sensor kinase
MFSLSEHGLLEQTLWERWWIRLGLIWLIWTLVGLFFTSQLYFAPFYTEGRISFSSALFSQLLICYLWALATPFVLRLTRSFPIERQNLATRVPLHFLVGLLLVIVLLAAYYLIYMWWVKGVLVANPSKIFMQVFFNLDRELSIYWLIVLLSHALNYYRRYQKGELRSSRLEGQLAQAQLQALKMQLHPHFLFNTLHSISALLHKDTDAARRMITLLGDFLRITFENGGSQEVTLKQEIDFLRGYLEIENIRFRDRLTTQIEVEPQTLSIRVPNLILQPIVENAIKHGIAPHSTPGRIEVTAQKRDEMLQIQVKDSGPGMSGSFADAPERGLGLANTRARLERMYGKAYRLDLANGTEGGLVVTLAIPFSPDAVLAGTPRDSHSELLEHPTPLL